MDEVQEDPALSADLVAGKTLSTRQRYSFIPGRTGVTSQMKR